MWRLLLFFLAIIAISAGMARFADQPGTLTVNWLGYEIQTTIYIAAIALLAALALLMFLWSLLRYLLSRPSAVTQFVYRRRERRGLDALSRGMVAVAAGDRHLSQKYAALAHKALPDEALTRLLRAQAAQLRGDRAAAREIFQAMTEQADTELLGLRGLFLEAKREQEPEAALQFAERAMRRKPELAWSVDALFEMQCQAGDWTAARKTLAVARRQRHVERTIADRRQAVLLAAEAMDLEASDIGRARELALQAHKLAPDLVPAAELAGRLLGALGKTSRAARLIAKTWALSPHPDLALAYAHVRPGDSPRDRLRRVRALVQGASGGVEGPIAVANAAIEAQEWQVAREALEPHLSERPAARICALMARIERGEFGDTGRVREWLARAVRAPRDPAWTADGVISDRWAAVSPVTGRLDAFEWKVPVRALEPEDEDIFLDAFTAAAPAVPAAGDAETPDETEGPAAEAAVPATIDIPEDAADPDPSPVRVAPAHETAPEESLQDGSSGGDGDGQAAALEPAPGAESADEAPTPETASDDTPTAPQEPKIVVLPRAPDDPGPDPARAKGR